MKMKMKSACVFLLIMLLLEVMCCQGCWMHEREALVGLKARLGNSLPWPHGNDCCQWERVECNTTTGRVVRLDLSEVMNRLGNINLSDFLVFEDLKSLNLKLNNIAGCVENEGLRLSNLEVLDMSYSSLSATSIVSCLHGLSSLKSLYLIDCLSNATSFHAFGAMSSGLLNLEVLDVSFNELANGMLLSLGGFKSLKELSLCYTGLDSELHIKDVDKFAWPNSQQVLGPSENSFSGDFLSSLSGLRNLKYLDLSLNRLDGSLDINGLLGLSNLEILDLRYNSISNFVVHQGSKSLSKLKVLYLDGNMIDGNMLRKSFQAFSSIRELYLSNNEFKGTIVAEDFRDLGNLEHLDMDHSSNLVNQFFETIGALTSLKVLSMSTCSINGTLPAADWHELKKLETLDLSFNEFEGSLPSSFGNMSSLRMLELSHNHFNGSFGSNLASLTSLEYLGFEENQFDFPILFSPFANNSKLKFIYGGGNKVILDSHPTLQNWVPKFQLQELNLSSTTETTSLPLPSFLLYQYNLTSLDFSGSKLVGEFPNWILENNTKMVNLVLRNCSFSGTFQLPSHPHLSMLKIDVSNNSITGQIHGNNISSIFPNLVFLNMSMNEIHGSLPLEIGHLHSLDSLDLSDNQLSGEIPKNISVVRTRLRLLRLSNNKLNGPMFPNLSNLNHLEQLYLDGNSLSGTITNGFSNTSLFALDISNNHFVGKLPSKVGSLSNLVKLSISNNHLEGSIPNIIVESKYLDYLDLSRNNLTGSVPSLVNSSLSFIHLSNNRLSGLPKRMFRESSSLTVLDLRYNEITTSIDGMMQDLSYTLVHILLLKGNGFAGKLPKQLCKLKDLTMLDLSHNFFSGPIPSCLSEIPFQNENTKLMKTYGPLKPVYVHLYQRSSVHRQFDENSIYKPPPRVKFQVELPQEKADFTTKKHELTYTGSILTRMAGIDLSCNKLNGSIPSELGNLTKIHTLNLSNNDLTGQIPATFSNLVQVESLDLSFNRLSGQIPPQLSGLTALSVFSVAHNNLSGATPDREGQFMTFDESSYEGNPFLCGPPLPKTCSASAQPPSVLLKKSYTNGDNGNLVDLYVFRVSFVVSYTLILLVTFAILYINPYWRRAWFYYMELVSINCYYFIEDNFCSFF